MSEKITDYTKILPTGKENAISSEELAALRGFDSTRALRADIAKSREAGQVIISSLSGGYYLPASMEEIAEFVVVQRTRAINCLKALKSARKVLKKAEFRKAGQMNLDDVTKDGSRLLPVDEVEEWLD